MQADVSARVGCMSFEGPTSKSLYDHQFAPHARSELTQMCQDLMTAM